MSHPSAPSSFPQNQIPNMSVPNTGPQGIPPQGYPPQAMPPQYAGNYGAPPMGAPPQAQPTMNYAPGNASYGPPSTGSYLPPPTPRPTECVTQVELTIKCNNLVDMDVFSKSDPLVVVLMNNRGHLIEKGRTENIRNSLNPEFNKKIQLDYYFEETQKLKIAVYDIDNDTTTLDDDDYLGGIECTLGQIVASSTFTRPLLGKGNQKMENSTITIHADEIDTGNKDLLQLTFRAKGLNNLRWFSTSNPFLEFHKAGPTGALKLVHRTEAVIRNLNPLWKTFEIRKQAVGGNNVESQILIKCFDSRTSGNHELIGETRLTLGQLLDGQQKPVTWGCVHPVKKQRKGNSYKDSGLILLTSCQIIKTHSFLDYVLGGTQINFTVAIDFTASNGDPREPKSLHYIHPTIPNAYISALWSVGGVVQDYDSDKQFPALGFGARIPPQFQVSHEFALNFNSANPFCSGVQGLVEAYMNCLRQVQLYGPTNFFPVINHVSQFAMQAHQQPTPENYFILLILTDGVVTDMEDTLRAVVKASYLPLSIIIVGVGKADFSQMEFLDADGTVLRTNDGTTAKRDIVQFVPFHKFEMGDPSLLAKEVLAEIPQQLTEYYRWRNVTPKPSLIP